MFVGRSSFARLICQPPTPTLNFPPPPTVRSPAQLEKINDMKARDWTTARQRLVDNAKNAITGQARAIVGAAKGAGRLLEPFWIRRKREAREHIERINAQMAEAQRVGREKEGARLRRKEEQAKEEQLSKERRARVKHNEPMRKFVKALNEKAVLDDKHQVLGRIEVTNMVTLRREAEANRRARAAKVLKDRGELRQKRNDNARYWAAQSQAAARERDEREAQMVQDEIDRVEAIENLEAEDDVKREMLLEREAAGVPRVTGGSSGMYHTERGFGTALDPLEGGLLPGIDGNTTAALVMQPVIDPYVEEDLSVYPSYYTLYTPFIHLHYHTYTYVHLLYMYMHPNIPLTRLVTPSIHPKYILSPSWYRYETKML